MIVKNESRIIERLLRSVRSVVDCYCICDTGSTDDTVARIQQFGQQHQLPGRVISCPFYTFGYNRTFALNAARDMADYVLLLDADMVLGDTASFERKKPKPPSLSSGSQSARGRASSGALAGGAQCD